MRKLANTLKYKADVDLEDRKKLRRGLLMAEREKTRIQGQRVLEKISEVRHPDLSPVAQSGLASSHFWAGDIRQSLYWARMTVASYPMTASAVWCSSLLICLFKMMGMRREKFEAERERILLMRKIAFHSDSKGDRIYALHELKKELESRDMSEDARRCELELEDLIESRHEFLETRDMSSTR